MALSVYLDIICHHLVQRTDKVVIFFWGDKLGSCFEDWFLASRWNRWLICQHARPTVTILQIENDKTCVVTSRQCSLICGLGMKLPWGIASLGMRLRGGLASLSTRLPGGVAIPLQKCVQVGSNLPMAHRHHSPPGQEHSNTSHDYHMIITWLSHDSHDYHMTVTSLNTVPRFVVQETIAQIHAKG